MNPLVLVDGSNAWYRAFSVTTLDPPGGPMLIFTSMIRKICNKYGKANIIVCWDAGDGGRSKIDPSYKSTRSHTAGVWDHLPLMAELLKHLGVQMARCDGYEADDVIGSIAKNSDRKVVIISYDRDFYQLVSENITIFRPARKVHGVQKPDEVIDILAAMEEFGCAPGKIPLLKSFTGDPSDNIPKLNIRLTAAFKEKLLEIIKSSTNIDEIYKQIDLLDPKYHSDLNSFKERAEISHSILKIKTDLSKTDGLVITNNQMSSEDVKSLCAKVNINSIKLEEWEDLENPVATQNSLF